MFLSDKLFYLTLQKMTDSGGSYDKTTLAWDRSLTSQDFLRDKIYKLPHNSEKGLKIQRMGFEIFYVTSYLDLNFSFSKNFRKWTI